MINLLWDNLFLRSQERKDLAKVLRETYLFKDLTHLELHFLKDFIHLRQYRAGEVVFKQGEAGVGMYIISSGSVDIIIEKPNMEQESLPITKLEAGDFMGEMALVGEDRRTATAQAVDDTSVFGFFRSDLAEISRRRPSIGVKIYARLAKILGTRLKEAAKQVTDLKRELQGS